MDKLDPASTALVLVDLQEGTLAYPYAPHSADAVRKAGGALAEAFRTAGGLVILVRVVFSADFGDALRQPVDRPLPGSGGLPDNWADFAPELQQAASDIVIEKRNWGAFYGTGLDMQLRRRGIRTLVVGGVATNMGVESTARDAYEHGYVLIFAEDAISSMAEEMHAFTMSTIFPLIGRVRSVADIVSALG